VNQVKTDALNDLYENTILELIDALGKSMEYMDPHAEENDYEWTIQSLARHENTRNKALVLVGKEPRYEYTDKDGNPNWSIWE